MARNAALPGRWRRLPRAAVLAAVMVAVAAPPGRPDAPTTKMADVCGTAAADVVVTCAVVVAGAAEDTAVPDRDAFTLDGGLPDLPADEDPDAVRELGLEPDRRYTVRLTARQWSLALDALSDDWKQAVAVDEDSQSVAAAARNREIAAVIRKRVRGGGGPATVTLSGDRWATLASDLASWADVLDQVAAEEEPGAVADGTATWAVLDLISRRLGGPAHPGFGFYR